MARTKRAQNTIAEDTARAERAFKEHIKALGLRSVEAYQAWCRQNGFTRKVAKSQHQREQERLHASRQNADTKLIRRKQQTRRKDRIVVDILGGKLKSDDLDDAGLRAVHSAYENTRRDHSTLDALKQLILHVLSPCGGFFEDRPAIANIGPTKGNTYVDGLLALAEQSSCWLPDRPLESWKPRSHNTERQFASLIRHLLARYPVPAFMDAAWFDASSDKAGKHREWFIHLGQGKNIRTADLPISYTKRMAHHFMETPTDYSVEEALRWGQIHGLGGDPRVVDAIRATRLSREFKNDEFWTTVFRFFIKNAMLDTAHYGPIIDYLHNQRFVPQEVYVRPGTFVRHPPPQPNLSMKGRRPESLLLQVEKWHRRLAKEAKRGVRWPQSGINGFELVEGSADSGNQRSWRIRELLSSEELNTEGRKMHHCVGTYASSCASRQTSIWAMEIETATGVSKVITIEVRLRQKLICQARGKYNELPDAKARRILSRWATREGLTIASYV